MIMEGGGGVGGVGEANQMWNFPSFLCSHTAGRACTFLNELQKCVFVSAHECEHVCVTAQRPL